MKRVVAFGPGRVNLIGEHTDYNGGLALPFAIAEGVTVTATAEDGGEIVAVAEDFGDETDTFPVEAPPRDADGWRPFVRGIVAELEIRQGARLEIAGDLPQGSGLSSSAALEVALALALLGLEGREVGRADLAKLCSKVENDWVGAQTGLLDQTASLLSTPGHALRIDFSTMETTPVPLELGDWRLVTVDSGDHHSLSAATGYNERRAECEEAAERLGVTTISEAREADAAELSTTLAKRVRHVLSENARVDATVAALQAEQLADVGQLLNESHASLRDDYEASTDRVEATVKRLREGGAAGARMVGGGFGGHVLALFPPDATPPEDAREVRPGPGARLLEDDG